MSSSPKKLSYAATTKPNDFSSPPLDLKSRASQINKTMLKVTLSPEKLDKLQKEALRGECRGVPEGRLAPKPKKKQDLLTLILKSEHKTNNFGTQIIKLPKLPFGEHKSYNEEPFFKDRHFFESTPDPANAAKFKDLEEITRKFRLHEKKYRAGKKSRLQTAQPLLSDMARCNVYEMGPGKLVCEVQDEVIKSYEKEKNKFVEVVKGNFVSTFKSLDEKAPERKYLVKRKINCEDEGRLVSRLMPQREMRDTDLSIFYSSKYSSLFESDEGKDRVKARRSSMR